MTGYGPGGAGRAAHGLQQLYYTSCERGLSGFAGFQFNAVSPGVTAEVMHLVEALSGYDPPRGLVESQTPQELEGCPVTLCFDPPPPGSGPERGAALVNVRYVGRDSTRRFGNYFAHALYAPSAAEFAAGCGERLAIELWGSPLWTATVSERAELPPLAVHDPLPPGHLDARLVAEFLAGQEHREQLGQLLAAAFGALEGGPSVVLVDRSTERVARWIAAVSFLLPPPLARRLSFSTYMLRPTRGRHHLIGSVPEAQPEIGPDEEDAFLLFDFATGRFPEVVLVHDVVRLLTRIGVASARSVWSWAGEYADGTERHPGDWHPPLAAAAAAGRIVLGPPDVKALLDWLPGADHLGPKQASVAGDLWRSRLVSGEAELESLARAARQGGDGALHRQVEQALLETGLRAYVRGGAMPRRSEPGAIDHELRSWPAELWRHVVEEARTPREWARLLLWAEHMNPALPGEQVVGLCGDLADAVLGAATGHDPSPGLRSDVKRLLSVSPAFRSALLGALEGLVEGRQGQHQLFAQFPADLLDFDDLHGRPLLQEHHLLARAERDPGSSVRILLRILKVRKQDFPDEGLLDSLWRGAVWTRREACELARRLPAGSPEGRGGDGRLGEWFAWSVDEEVRDDAGLQELLDLCALLHEPARRPWLPSEIKGAVSHMLALDAELKSGCAAVDLVQAFTQDPHRLPRPVLALKRFRLPAALLASPIRPEEVQAMLRRLDPDTLDDYLEKARLLVEEHCGRARRGDRGRRGVPEVLLGHVAGLALASTKALGLADDHRDQVEQIFAKAVHEWRPEDTARLAAGMRSGNPGAADAVMALLRDRPGVVAETWRRLKERGRGQRTDPLDDRRR